MILLANVLFITATFPNPSALRAAPFTKGGFWVPSFVKGGTGRISPAVSSLAQPRTVSHLIWLLFQRHRPCTRGGGDPLFNLRRGHLARIFFHFGRTGQPLQEGNQLRRRGAKISVC